MKVAIDVDGDIYRKTVPEGWRVVEPYDKQGNHIFVLPDDKAYDIRAKAFTPVRHSVSGCYVSSCYKVIRRIHRKK